MLKKIKHIALCICLALLCIYHLPAKSVYATEFEGNEDQYYELCKSDDLSKEDVQVCREFKRYLADKQNELEDRIESNQKKIEDLNLELIDIYELIADVSAQINEQQAKIDVLEAEIARLEDSINKKDQQIRERMYVLQSNLNSNVYLEFLMGATSIDDFFSRMASIDEITAYDHDLITTLSAQKDEVEASRAIEQEERERLDGLKAQHDALAKRIATQIEEVSEEVERALQESEEYERDLSEISDSIQNAIDQNGGYIDGPISDYGFSSPVQWGIVTAAGWNYPSGGAHNGMDIGGRFNSELYAPCDGLVIYVATGCQSDGGYLGNSCNGGAGNYLVMVTEMNGTMYGMRFLHMMNNNYIGWSSGKIIEVSRGDVIGHMGHSGNSTGTHLHFDIVNLGDIGYTEAIRRFQNYGSYFGVPYGYSGRCSVRDIPCREEASAMFGYRLYQEVGK